MSQTSSSKKGRPVSRRSNVPAVLSALIVIAVFAALGVLLASNQPGSGTQTGAVPTTAPADTKPAPAGTVTPAAEESATFNYSAPPPMTIDPSKNYTATIVTPRGNIVIKLRPDLAPQTVNNFVFLAREGYYNGLTWHRVLPGFMAQGGDPTGTGAGGPGYTIPDEFTDKVLFDRPGLVAMARTNAPNSAGSQFFITTAPAEHLNQQYTIFGEVIEGQEIVDGIPLRNPDENPAEPGEQMLTITISEG